MTKQEWQKHIASLGLPLDDRAQAVKTHSATCPQCKARRQTRQANRRRRERGDAYRSCGLVKVIGAVSGQTYWE